MPRFICLIQFTEEGAKKIHETARRADAFAETVKAAGGSVQSVYWTTGAYDGVLIFDAENDEAAAALAAALGSAGNVKTQTMRAFGRSEIEGILSNAQALRYRA